MAKTKIVSDRLNTFFTNNKMTVGDSKPVTGSWSKGDIVISTIQANGECGWICVESGTPGRWEIFGAGGGGNLSTLSASETVDGPVTEISLSGLGVNVSSSDKLTVHYNSIHLFEGIDYEIVEQGTKIRKLDGGSWNESSIPGSLFVFELLKMSGVSNKLNELKNNTIINTDNVVSDDTIDLSDYITKNEVGDLNNLQTENKDDIISAINELKMKLDLLLQQQ